MKTIRALIFKMFIGMVLISCAGCALIPCPQDGRGGVYGDQPYGTGNFYYGGVGGYGRDVAPFYRNETILVPLGGHGGYGGNCGGQWGSRNAPVANWRGR